MVNRGSTQQEVGRLDGTRLGRAISEMRGGLIPSPLALTAPSAEGVDHQREGRGGMAAARIVEMVAGKGFTPVLKHPDQASLGNVLDAWSSGM